jgi:ATP-dependent helicase/nuclease subunit A
MSKTPNFEQKKAIEHSGGVLLRAGAGSGKTFVLVEHIAYLTENWINEFKKNSASNLSFEEFIRTKYSQVVMMTFTKKAAGEMSIRLTERMQALSKNNQEDAALWLMAYESLPVLTVTTIDGFCKKLISAGYFPNLSTEAPVIFDPERINQVRLLFDEWFKIKSETSGKEILDIVIREKKSLLSSFTSVFNDPELRMAWKKFSIKEIHPDKLSDILKKSFELNDLSSALFKIHALDLPTETERSAFEKNVAKFQASGLPVVVNQHTFEIYRELFAPIKSLQPERTESKKDLAHQNAHEGLKELKAWIVDWKDILVDYQTHFESKVLPWVKLCFEIFNFIEQRLDPNQGMTFGDIEYYVSIGLEDENNRSRIHQVFKYFIVDEFQDTSRIQFNIIEHLIDSDFNRLFCVGDAKQAIYGFRGGELSVFQNCEVHVPQVMTLANNYRSGSSIINFNNSLFKRILPLGQHFEGHDPFSVMPEDQNVPEDFKRDTPSLIEIHSLVLDSNTDDKKTYSAAEINRLEAFVISKSIEKERKQNPEHVCTVLYQRLGPSMELIREFMNKGVGFTAQFKINLLDDPILGIFLCLLKRIFDKKNSSHDNFPLLVLKTYFSILNVSSQVSEDDLKHFDLDVKYWGLTEAFSKFLQKMSITNENADINLGTIQTLSTLFHQDPESILVQLTKGQNERLSLELRSGEHSHKVQIMTAHASKGLEFDTVYLGGIFTNGKDMSDGEMFGKYPGSFTWYEDLGQRIKHKSPQYFFENEMSKYKNFSESKRLFYVACTRAINKLIWVDFELDEKAYRLPKNSWIRGLRVWRNEEINQSLVKVCPFESSELDTKLQEESRPQLPLFFHDSMGIYSKGEGRSELMIVPELSVTRLNALIDCPRKYYMANVLKITDSQSQTPYVEETEELGSVVSSTERGTEIHLQISRGMQKNFTVPRESMGTDQELPIKWCLNLLKQKAVDYELISEVPLKFKFFNFMISGIPDLVLMPKADTNAEVWDFKTGRSTQENLNHYWLQLTIYAYALYSLGKVPKNKAIDLVLCFVDEQKVLTRSVSAEQCRQELYPIWLSQMEPWKINPDHCTQCSYGDICPR